MSSNKYLSAFLTSAAALGGLYLLDRFLGGETRANPKRYQHRKVFDEFTKEEKEDIARKYKNDNQSLSSLSKEFKATPYTIRQILEDQECELRDKATATVLAKKIELTDEQKESILTQWEDETTRPSLQALAQATGMHVSIITNFLVEDGLHEIKTRDKELTEKDKEKLVKAKEAANREGRKLMFGKLGKELKLDHKDVSVKALLRFFAERGLNIYGDFTTTLSVEQQERILSYFEGGEQTISITEIAEREGLNLTAIRFFLYSHNIIPERASTFLKVELQESQKDLIIKLMKEKRTNEDIAAEMGLSPARVHSFIKEYRASQGRTGSRRLESMHAIRDRLELRDPESVQLIMDERDKTPPTPYRDIVDKLRNEKGVSSRYSASTVRAIHLEELSKRK